MIEFEALFLTDKGIIKLRYTAASMENPITIGPAATGWVYLLNEDGHRIVAIRTEQLLAFGCMRDRTGGDGE